MPGTNDKDIATLIEDAPSDTATGDRLAHLVLKSDWPIALCGALVRENLGVQAPAMDRCVDCLKVASSRGLGRPGWNPSS